MKNGSVSNLGFFLKVREKILEKIDLKVFALIRISAANKGRSAVNDRQYYRNERRLFVFNDHFDRLNIPLTFLCFLPSIFNFKLARKMTA